MYVAGINPKLATAFHNDAVLVASYLPAPIPSTELRGFEPLPVRGDKSALRPLDAPMPPITRIGMSHGFFDRGAVTPSPTAFGTWRFRSMYATARARPAGMK